MRGAFGRVAETLQWLVGTNPSQNYVDMTAILCQVKTAEMHSTQEIIGRLVHGTPSPKKQRADAGRLLDIWHQMNAHTNEIPGNGQVLDPAIGATSRSDGTAEKPKY